jgi:hypothetical protein
VHPRAVRRELVEEGHRLPTAAAVPELPVDALCLGGAHHRQDRGDPDAARDEDVAGGRQEREVVAGADDLEPVAGPESFVDVLRTAERGLVPEDGDPVAGLVGGVAAQGVLAHERATQSQVDVGAGRPLGQRLAVGVGEGERQHAVGLPRHLLDEELLALLDRVGRAHG